MADIDGACWSRVGKHVLHHLQELGLDQPGSHALQRMEIMRARRAGLFPSSMRHLHQELSMLLRQHEG
jgi:hypothetical protein